MSFIPIAEGKRSMSGGSPRHVGGASCAAVEPRDRFSVQVAELHIMYVVFGPVSIIASTKNELPSSHRAALNLGPRRQYESVFRWPLDHRIFRVEDHTKRIQGIAR